MKLPEFIEQCNRTPTLEDKLRSVADQVREIEKTQGDVDRGKLAVKLLSDEGERRLEVDSK